MAKPTIPEITIPYLAHLRAVINAKEANALTDDDAWRTNIDTDVLRAVIRAAEKGVKGEELARVGRTVVHLDSIGIIKLDHDTRRELDAALEPFAKPPALHVVAEDPAPSI
jgi:hypothetical protein